MAFSNLSIAKENKKDEFYTTLEDINSELIHYSDKFQNKVVFCNCDDFLFSNFVKYFLIHFHELGLKELIATGFPSKFNTNKTPMILRISNTCSCFSQNQYDLKEENIEDFLNTYKDMFLQPFPEEDFYPMGDFRSNTSVSLLKKADIVVTNPPFSLFREYISLIEKYHKKYIVIGHQNAITYKEIFPLIKENKMWLGYGFQGNVGFFESPYEDNANSSQHKKGKIRISGVTWFTNINHDKRHKILPLNLDCTYAGNENQYPMYDNYKAINVDKTNQIPYDYDGVMGVPITFLNYFCPEQFDIIGLSSKENKGEVERFHDNAYYNGYVRGKVVTRIESNMPLLSVAGKGGTLCKKDGCPDLYQLYWRIFIKKKK